MAKSRRKQAVGFLVVVIMMVLGLVTYIDKTVYKLQQTTRLGPTEISGTQTAFFSQVIKNVTPFKLRLLGVSFQAKPEEMQYSGGIYLLSYLEPGIPNAQIDVPVNFHLAEVPIVIHPDEEQYLGVYMENVGNVSATAYNMTLHCKLGPFDLNIITPKHCTITPSTSQTTRDD